MKTTWVFAVVLGLVFSACATYGQSGGSHMDQPPQPAQPESNIQPAPTQIPVDQQPSKEQLAKLFEVMHLSDQIKTITQIMPAMIKQQIQSQMASTTSKLVSGRQLTPEQQARLSDLMSKYIQKAMTVYSAEDMIDDMTVVYQRHLTGTDVDAMIAFYGSPAGQHLLDAQPSIMKEYMPIVMTRQQKATAGLTAEMEKDIADFTKSISADSTNNPALK
jgi:hypothetical protein